MEPNRTDRVEDSSLSKSAGESEEPATRRRFLQAASITGAVTLSGCIDQLDQLEVGSDGVTWGDDSEAEEDVEELDLSQYEDGSFEGESPTEVSGERDGVTITVSGEIESDFGVSFERDTSYPGGYVVEVGDSLEQVQDEIEGAEDDLRQIAVDSEDS